MNRRQLSSVIISSCALLTATLDSRACGSGSSSITNLSSASGDTFQITGLNAAGQVTGFFYGSSAHAFLYQGGVVTDLGTLGGSTSEGLAINFSGQIVGVSSLPGDSQFNGFLYTGGSLLDLGTLGGPYSSASVINDAGQIAGDSLLPNASATTAFFYSNGSMVSLGTLGGGYSSPFALNKTGQVVGQSSLANGDIHGFISSVAGLVDLGTLGGDYSSAFAINDTGIVVGESSVSSSYTHAFVFSGGVMTDLGTFDGTYSSAYQVNANGQVIGIATTAGDLETHGFIYSGGTLVDLGTLGGTNVSPYAISSRGQVVGAATLSDGTSHAFLWQTNQILDLNTFLPANSGWELSDALFINDAGRIVGSGVFNGVSQSFILDLASANNPPVAVAGPDQTVDCQAQVTLDGSGSSDPNNDPLVFEWSSGGSVLGTSSTLTVSLPLGTNVVTLKVTDPCGASAQTNVTVIVADTTPPNGSCPGAVTASADANCQASIPNLTSQVIATDNCTPSQALVITQSPAPGTLVGLGPHTITLTVTDSSGNSSSCGVLFTVVDTTPPAIVSTPASFTLSAGSDCQAQVPNVLPDFVANDSCTTGNQLVKTQNPPAGTLIGIGSHSILLTVTDSAGNSATASVAFKVADTTPPTILSGPASMKVSADANCQGTVPSVLGAVLVTDNCTPAAQILLTQNPPAGTVLPRGLYSITVTATDAAGNSSTLNVPLEIDDTTPPTIVSTPSSFTLSAGSDCQAQVPNVLPNFVANDSCTPANQLVKSQNPPAGTLIGIGSHSILLTVTDSAGNSSTATVSFKVADTTPPVILSSPSPITVSANANCEGVVPNVLAGVIATDNCTPVSQLVVAQNPAAGTVLPQGQYTIVVTVTDASGNSASVGVLLLIADTTPPVVQSLCANPSVLSPPNHQLVPVTVSAVVSDSCDAAPVTKIISITCNDVAAPGDIQITGALTATLAASKTGSGNTRIYTITVQATDVSGNSSAGAVTVTVPKSSGSSGSTTSSFRTGITSLGGLIVGVAGEDQDRDRDDRVGDNKRR